MTKSNNPTSTSVVAVGRLMTVLQEHIDQVPAITENIVGVTTHDELASALASGTVAGVLLGGGLDDEARAAYRAQVLQSAPGVKVVDHVGGKAEFVEQLLSILPPR